MLESILFIVVIVLLFWIATVSNRVSVLERKIRLGEVPRSAQANFESMQQAQEQRGFLQPKNTATSMSAPISDMPAPSPMPESALSTPVVASDSNILARIGIAALVLGLGFFFKYSIDQGWINEWTRLFIGLAVGALMLTLGLMWKKQYGHRADMLSGGGIVIGFFSIFAGHIFYNLYSYNVAIFFYVILAALAVTLAFIKDARALASVGLVGAFWAPLFFGLHSEQQVFIFSYLGILSVCSLFLFSFKQWYELPVLSLTASCIVLMGWIMSFYTVDFSLPSWFFSLALLLIYSLGACLIFRERALKKELVPDSDTATALIVFVSALQFFFFTESLLSQWHQDLKPLAGLLGGLAMLICYILVDRLEPKRLNYATIFSAAILLLSAIVWQFSDTNQIYFILALSILSFVVGYIQKREELRVSAVAIAMFGVAKSLLIQYGNTDQAFLLNVKLGLTMLSILVLGCFAWAYRKLEVSQNEKESSDTILVFATCLLWFAISWDINNSFASYLLQNTRNILITFWWLILAVGTLVLGRSLAARSLKKVSLLLFGISIIKAFLYDVWALDLIYRIIAFISLGVILLVLSFVYNRDKNKISQLFE